MSVQHTQVFAAEPLIEQAPDLTEEFVQTLTVQGTLPNGQTVQAPEKVTDFIRAQLTALLNHQNIAVNFTPDVLTTSEAAELLGLSRPTLAKWADEGRLPSHKAGTHRASPLSLYQPSEEAWPSVPPFGRNCKAYDQGANRLYVVFSFSWVLYCFVEL